MLDNNEMMNNRIDDESLDGAAGGVEIRTTQFDKSERIETHNAVLDNSMNHQVFLLGGATRSGQRNEKVEAIKNKNGVQIC